MSANCGVCGLKCDDEKIVVKCNGNCGAMLHNKCVTSKTRGSKREWFCESCKPDKEQSSVSSNKSSSTSITKEFLVSTLEAFKNEVFNEFKSYNKEFKEFKTSLDFFSSKIDTSNELMKEMKEELKRLKEDNKQLREENTKLKNTVDDLSIRMRNIEQYSRQSNIEISGVPYTENENLELLLTDIARAIDVQMKKETIVAAHRVPSFNRKRTPPIVVKFLSRRERDEWINAYKTTRPLTADKVNPRMPKEKVFINEHLSPANKLLLARTKEAARNRDYKYVWTKDGKIFVRKDTGEPMKKIEIEADLNKL